MSDFSHKIFVFGTLKRMFHNHPQMCGARFVCETRTADPVFRMISMKSDSGEGLYCPAVKERGDGFISGEVYYEISGKHLKCLDNFEDVHTGRYQRIDVNLETGESAWMYVHVDPNEPSVESGQVSYDNSTNTYTWVLP